MRDDDAKPCTSCQKVLPSSAFGPRLRSSDGLSWVCRECERIRLQLAKHGLTAEDKEWIVAWQEGCATCGRPDPGAKGWVVDHDRTCCPGDRSCEACRRGILCTWCNTALGYAQDDPTILRRLADYLECGVRLP